MIKLGDMNQTFDLRGIGEFHKSAKVSHARDDAVNQVADFILVQEFFGVFLNGLALGKYEFAHARLEINDFNVELLANEFSELIQNFTLVAVINPRVMILGELRDRNKGLERGEFGYE